jgi:hypothetical protein
MAMAVDAAGGDEIGLLVTDRKAAASIPHAVQLFGRVIHRFPECALSG